MTQLASILILVLSACLIIVTALLCYETRARKDAEDRADIAQAMWNAATKAMNAKQETDEKISAVRSANSVI